MGNKDIFEHCTKCDVFETELENIKKDIEDMKVDIKVFQKVNQEFEVRFSKLETFITEKFIQIYDKVDSIITRMDKESENKKNRVSLFLGQFIYPGALGLLLAYLAYKISG